MGYVGLIKGTTGESGYTIGKGMMTEIYVKFLLWIQDLVEHSQYCRSHDPHQHQRRKPTPFFKMDRYSNPHKSKKHVGTVDVQPELFVHNLK